MSVNPTVIFDWDGTIMNSAPRIVSAMLAAAEKVQLPIPSEMSVRQIIGLSLSNAFEILFGQLEKKIHDNLFEEYRYQYVEAQSIPTPLFDGVETLLVALRNSNINLAVATGKARHGLERVWKINNVHELFHDSICADEAESKPHPQMLHNLMSRNQWQSEKCIMIGDTSHDLLMANNAGIASIGVTFGAHDLSDLVACNPFGIAHHYGEVKQVLSKWLQKINYPFVH
ncbi:MAG: HAD-IA family hydrolase [Gammaproteobacteria bacterium]|nr:HAD-IA family hydrolase [Gammaproteobacteria bacterium]